MKLRAVFAACIVLWPLAAAPAWQADVPAAAVTDEQIARLIAQLGDAQFAVRQRAHRELVKLGFDAFDALVDAENSDDPEISMQAGYLVRQIRSGWTREGDPKAIQQIFKNYEVQNEEGRLAKIKQLAALKNDQGLPWLCRLVRFERSGVLSKQAALAIIGQELADDAARNRRADTIRKELSRARRPAARWLEADLQAQADPADALAKWAALADAERQILKQHPQETHSQIVLALLRRQVELLDRLGRSAETGEVMRQMVLVERGDSTSLTELIDWLVKRKAWDVVDQVADRFSASFEVDAVLMYTLCEARLAQGNKELADKTAERALKISGESQEEHWQLADRLGDRGLTTWAEREFRQVIALGPQGTVWDIFARDYLANGLHDRGLDQEASDLIKQLVDAADKDPTIMQRVRTAQQAVEASINLLRANMYFYASCHAEAQGDAAGRRKLLETALENDKNNIEVLIGMYQVTAVEPAKRAEIVKLVREAIDQCREKIEEQAERPTFYNQIAWLIANTEGDLDEALALSQKSLELARQLSDPPRRLGGLLDTLAHCYAAKKDYAMAVATQEEASKLDPQTQSIKKALAKFRAAQAQQQAERK